MARLKKLLRRGGRMYGTVFSAGTLGLVPPKLVGIKSSGARRSYRRGGQIGRVAAVATVGTFALAGAPVALGGAGVGSGGLLSKVGSFFGGGQSPSGMPDDGDQAGGNPTTGLAASMLALQKGGSSVELARAQAGDETFSMPSMPQNWIPWAAGAGAVLLALFMWRSK